MLNPWRRRFKTLQIRGGSNCPHLRETLNLKVLNSFSKNLKPNTWKWNLKPKCFKFHFSSPHQTPKQLNSNFIKFFLTYTGLKFKSQLAKSSLKQFIIKLHIDYCLSLVDLDNSNIHIIDLQFILTSKMLTINLK